MIQRHVRVLVILAVVCALTTATAGLRTPNRGRQLFLLIEIDSVPEINGSTLAVAMDEPNRVVFQAWHRDRPTYDFIYAAAKQTDSGSTVHFRRHVMTDDYSPRQEDIELTFPYAEQPRYRFFDIGYITGFYRHSVDDIDPREFMQQQSSNQAMQLTASKPAVYAWSVCRPRFSLRRDRSGLAAADLWAR
jgi:hypothetical protein